MASGKLGNAALTAATLTQLYAGPGAGKCATLSVMFVNGGTMPTAVRLAISTSATSGGVVLGEYVTYGLNLAPGEEYEKAGLVLSSGEYVWAYAQLANVIVRVHGFEGAV